MIFATYSRIYARPSPEAAGCAEEASAATIQLILSPTSSSTPVSLPQLCRSCWMREGSRLQRNSLPIATHS